MLDFFVLKMMDKWFCVDLRWAAIVNAVCGIFGSILLVLSLFYVPNIIQRSNDVAEYGWQLQNKTPDSIITLGKNNHKRSWTILFHSKSFQSESTEPILFSIFQKFWLQLPHWFCSQPMEHC